MKRVSYYFLILLLLTSCDGCKSGDPKPKTELEKLPSATQEGKNTFGCLLNGKAWVPATSIDAGAVYQLGTLQIYGGLYAPFRQLSIVLREINNQLDSKTYSLTDFPTGSAKAYVEIPPSLGCVYDYSATYSGSVTITKIDRVKYIISGVFEFSTARAGCDTLKITNGRFDLEYIP